MIDYENILYNTVKNKLKNTDTINRFNEILSTLNRTDNIDTLKKSQDLVSYLHTIQVDPLTVNMVENPKLKTAINTLFTNSIFSEPLILTDQKAQNKILAHITSNDDFNIKTNKFEINDTDELLELNVKTEDSITNFVNDFNNMLKEKTLISILQFICKNDLLKTYNKLLKVQNKEDDYRELNIPVYVYDAITNESYIESMIIDNYIDNYIDISNASNDKELFDALKIIDTNGTLKVPADLNNNSKNILDAYKKSELNIKKSDNNPVPADCSTVDDFINSWSTNSDKVVEVKKKITDDIYLKWNTKLIDIANKTIPDSMKTENATVFDLLKENIYLDSQHKNKVSFQTLLSTLVLDKNQSIFNKKNIDNTGNTFGENLFQEIKTSINKLRTGKLLNINNSCSWNLFINKLTDLNKENFANLRELEEFGKNDKIWGSKDGNAYLAINTLYKVFSNVSNNMKYIKLLFTIMIPNN